MKKQKAKPATSFAEWAKEYGRGNLARALGVTWKTVDFWVRGRNYPRPESAQRILEIAGGALTMDQIFAERKA